MELWTRSFSAKCGMLYYSSSQTHINEYVLVVGMQWNEHGGRMCHDSWDNLKNSSTSMVQ
jgi:hypothetical protein